MWIRIVLSFIVSLCFACISFQLCECLLFTLLPLSLSFTLVWVFHLENGCLKYIRVDTFQLTVNCLPESLQTDRMTENAEKVTKKNYQKKEVILNIFSAFPPPILVFVLQSDIRYAFHIISYLIVHNFQHFYSNSRSPFFVPLFLFYCSF